MKKLSHIDHAGNIQMVDVSSKRSTRRRAVACAKVEMQPRTLKLIAEQQIGKGNVLAAAKIAGIMAAKKTGELIPLCHPLELTLVTVDLQPDFISSQILIRAEVRTMSKTGVEMEAMTAVSVAALTVYDMCKSADKEIIIGEIMLLEKSGGKSGNFTRKMKQSRG
ncbi:MAG TPA: cyclic pyranopterin monophosphate synthase MoaC [Smithellaceae bacterium]|nr:cyclic pyranopterin monophosphate synthase MoaC [Smithellaceae bacterium]